MIVLLHGLLDSPATWDPIRHRLKQPVLTPTLAGHHGGAPATLDLAGDLERQLDAHDIETAHLVGNSLGGYLALELAARGRAKTVTALAPGGGWADGDTSYEDTLDYQEGLAHLAPGAPMLIQHAREHGWPLDPAAVTCPLRFIWGTADPLLPWPRAAERYRRWFPTADWIELDGVGHYPHREVPLETTQFVLDFIG